MAIPLKVQLPNFSGSRIGIAASSYAHLREVLRTRYAVSDDSYIQQEDGTLVCDDDYFQLLEPNTKLKVVAQKSKGSCSYKGKLAPDTVFWLVWFKPISLVASSIPQNLRATATRLLLKFLKSFFIIPS